MKRDMPQFLFARQSQWCVDIGRQRRRIGVFGHALQSSVPASSSSMFARFSSRPVPFFNVKQGQANITAIHNETVHPSTSSTSVCSTRLQISHKSPVRVIIPYIGTTTRNKTNNVNADSVYKKNRVPDAAAIATIGHYGGGMAAGDDSHVTIRVEPHARLIVNTQSANRIYKQPTSSSSLSYSSMSLNSEPSTSRMRVRVEEYAQFIHVPDYVSLLRSCRYRQQVTFHLHPTAQLLAVDWISAGRIFYNHHDPHHAGGEKQQHHQVERWQQEDFGAGTEIIIRNTAVLRDAQHSPVDMDWSTIQFHNFATVYIYNYEDEKRNDIGIVDRFRQIQMALCAMHTSVRRTEDENNNFDENNDEETHDNGFQRLLQQLSGRALIGVNRIDVTDAVGEIPSNKPIVDPSLYVIRIAGNSNEDLYRIFHYATGFYGERIVTTASRSAPVPSIVTKNNSNHIRDKNIYHRDKRQQTQPSSLSTNQSRNNTFGDSVVTFDSHKNSEAFSVPWFPSKSWRLFMLSDSALPVGSFAHSSGMEAAHQWGMIAGSSSQDDDVKRYVWAATQHAIGMWMPVILHHRYGRMIQTIDEMLEFDEYVHSFLCSNEIACATSLEQGRNLLRVYLECFVDPVRWTNHPPKEANGNDGSFVLSLLRNVHRHGRYKHWCTVWSFIFQNEMKSSSFDYDAFSLAATTFVGYNVARDIVAAAVRLNLVGAMAGQRILKEIGDELQRQQQQQQQQQQHPLLSFASAGHEAENPCSPVPFLPLPLVGCAPVIDILQSSHSILSSRLFRS